MKYLLAGLLLILSAQVSAEEQKGYIPLLPPPEFDYPYAGKLRETTVETLSELEEICHNSAALACARYPAPGALHIKPH